MKVEYCQFQLLLVNRQHFNLLSCTILLVTNVLLFIALAVILLT